MDTKVIKQPVKSSTPGGKQKKSSIPGVTIIEFTENIPQGCSGADIERRPIPLTIQEGKNANFKAVVRGNPKPTVVWSFKEENLSNGNRYKIYYDMITDEYVLQIKQLTTDDAGSYKCTVSNEYGEAKCITNLNIIEVGFKKKLKKPGEVQDKNTDPGDFRKMLKKRAPPPVKKEEKVLNEKIWEILMRADKKDYERICMEYGLTDFRGMLTKLKQMKKEREEKQGAYVESISNLKPVEAKPDGSASFGFDMELKNPDLNIYLYKDGKLIQLSLDDDRKHHLKHVGKRYTFCIKDLELEDVGLYKVNVEGAVVFATEVDISLIPVEFKRQLQEVKCKETEDGVFECIISIPLPVEWSYKKVSLKDSEKYQIKVSPDGLTHYLMVKDVHPVDKGMYTISAGAGSSNAHLIVEKSLDTTSPPSRRKKLTQDFEHSQEDSLDVSLKQGFEDAKKEGLKCTTGSSLHDKDSMTKDNLKGKKDFSSEDDSTKFGTRDLLNSSTDGFKGATKNGRGGSDRMGKDGSGSLNGVGKDGFAGLDRMGEDGKGGLDGLGKDGKGRLDGMGKDGKGRLDGMGKDGKGRLDGMGKDGKGRLDGMDKDGKVQLDGMGKDGKGKLDGMDKDGMGRLDGTGKDGSDRMDGMGKDGKGRLDGMGKDGKSRLDGMGKDGMGRMDGMGKDDMGRLDGMGKDGMGRMDGMGKDGSDRMDGKRKDGKSRLDGMGKDGMGRMDGMGKDDMGRLDGMGKDGMGRMDGMGKDGSDRMDGMGKDGTGRMDGMGKDGMGRMDGMGKDGKSRLDGMGKDGMGRMDGMGKDDMGRLDGMGKDGMGRMDGMGKDGSDRMDGKRKDGKSRLDGMGKDGMGRMDGMGKDDMGRLDGMGKDGMGRIEGMGKDGSDRMDGKRKDGKSRLDGMGKDGTGRMDGMGKDGMGRLDGMGKDGSDRMDGKRKDGKSRLDGMGKDGMGRMDGMGKDDMGRMDGMGKDDMGRLDGMGKDGMGRIEGMGKDGKGRLDGMGKDGMGRMDGMGKDGMGRMFGMGKDDMGRLDGIGKDGMGRIDGMGKDGSDRMDGKRKDGKSRLDGMGKDGMGRMDGMGKDGMGRLDGMGKDGMGRLDGMGKDGSDRMDGSGINNLAGLDGSGKGGRNGLDASGWREMQNNLADGSNKDKDSLTGYGDSTRAGTGDKGKLGLNDIDSLSMPGDLSSMSGSDGSGKGGCALSLGIQKGLPGKDQMSIQNESMAGGKLDSSPRQQSGSARRKKGKLSESDISELTADQNLKNKEPAQRFKSGLSDVSARKGEAAELCCVMANEKAQGSWFKNGEKITSGDGKIITKEGALQKLTLSSVQEEDSGMYTFEADGGKTEASLFVEDPPEFDHDVLDQLGKKLMLVKAGHTATVKVPFSGKPPIKVSWYKDGDELFEDNRISIDNSGNFTQLSISNCNRKDSGKLAIKLKNESGIANANISLAVTDKPQAPQGPVEVLESSESRISFKWKPPKDDGGKPIERYVVERQQGGRNTWTKVGELDKSTTAFSFDKVEHGKNYKFKVWAVNSEGVSEALVSDTVTAGRKAVPGALAKPNILNASSKSITLAWTPPHNTGSSRIIGYIVEKRKKGSNTWTVVTDTPITAKKWTVTDVVKGLEYEFRVIAVNSSGPGVPSCESEAVFAREPIKPPGTVRDLRVTDSTYSTISLAWTPPTYQGNDVPKGYIVEMKSSGSTTWTRCNNAAVGMTSYTVKGLKKMEMHFLRVRAINDGGMGEPIELDNYVLAMPPPVFPKFILDGTVKSYMIIKEGNSIRVQMPFEASPPPEVIWLKDGLPLLKQATVTSTSHGTQLFIPVAQRSDSGIYSITLKNPFGQESFSFEIRATAIPKPPGPITLNENVPNTVTVSWEPSRDEPLDDHLHYVVMKRDSSRRTWHTVGDNIFNNSFTVINVVPRCKYYFRVLAKNDMGYSEPSDTQEPWCISKQRDPTTFKLPNYKALNNTRAPEFSVKLKSHIAPSGSDINMSCAVKGAPPPTVSWFKNNVNIMDDANFWSTNVCGVCSLCIFAASPKESGEYTAIAENSVGRAICSTRLTVRE